jgi:hypothetical protein
MTEEAKQGQSAKLDDAEAMARLQEQINNLPVSEHVVYMLQSLSSLAIDRLGMVEQSAARRDPAQARLAIDAFRALLSVLERERPPEEIATYRGMLSQLQMAYVGALNAGAAPAPEEAPQRQGAAAPDETPAEQEPPKKAAKPRAAAGGARAKGSAGGGAKGGK